ESSLARAADIFVDASVPKEACPHNLAPTTSTTAMLALGDALALAVMEARNFSRADYALLHPAGSLGRRLLLSVGDIMRTGEALAVIGESTTLTDALFAITKAGAGAACVTDATGKLSGILTDGDIRRFLLRAPDTALREKVADAMSRTPRVTTPEKLAVEALDQFENDVARPGDLPVVSEDSRPVGMLMLKDLVRAGIVLPDGDAVR
ncbi:MAG: CBS domain-containing protein, partial [Armatimonadetes bacterium]|nr:CBS domain-containing protein [Armatimonadota bacterium]